MIGPFWFTPGNLKRSDEVRSGAGALECWGIGVDAGAGGSGTKADSIAAIRSSHSGSLMSGTAAVPQRPKTQRPNAEDLREPGVAVEAVLELSTETTDAESNGRLVDALAATEARRERDDAPRTLARSAVMVGADMIGGVDTSSTLGDMRR